MSEKTATRPATVGAPAALATSAARPAARGANVGALLLRFGMVWVLIALVIAAQIIYPGFLAWGNIQNLPGPWSTPTWPTRCRSRSRSCS
jgi:ribose transport system permease protein